MLNRFTPRRKKTGADKVSMQTKPVFGANGGIKRSMPPIEIEDMYLYWANNAYVNENKIKKRNGYALFGTSVPLAGDPVMNITQFFKYDGTVYLSAFTTKNAYRYNPTTKKWDLTTEHEVVCDCEDAWIAQAGVTSTASTTKRYGTYSAKHVIATGTTGLASTRAITSADLTGYTHLYFYIRSSKVLTAGQLQLLLDDTVTCASPLELLDVPAVPIVDTWYEFCVALSNPALLTAVISVGLKAIVDLSGVDIYLDNIMAVNCFTADSNDKVQTEQIYDETSSDVFFIYTNGVDNIKYWTGTNNWADLGGTPNKARRLINFEHYLMLLNTTVSTVQAPQRIEWPQIGKPATWTGEDSGNNSLAGTPDFIEGAVYFRSDLVIFKNNSIASCSFVGGVDPFEFEESKIKRVGCSAVGSIQNLDDTIIFLGWDNVYTYDGFSVKPKGNDIIIKFLDELNPSKLSLIHSHIIRGLNLYLLFVPSTNSDYPDYCWIFDYIKETWTFWKFDDSFTSSGYYFIDGRLTIGELIEKIGNLNFRLGSSQLQDLKTFSLFGSNDGYIYKYDETIFNDNGVAIDGYIDTKSYVFNGVNLYSMLCQIALFGKGDDITVLVSINDGVTFSSIGTITQNTSTELANFLRKVDQVGDRFMVRFQNNTLDEWFELSGWELGYIEKTRKVV